jgi:hypothetical protein
MVISPSQPFNNPASSPALVEMWRNNLRKSFRPDPIVPVAPLVVTINFDGGAEPPVVGLGGLVRITFPCRILNCYIEAGIGSLLGPAPMAASATVYLGLAEQGAWASGSTPLYGATIPTLTAAPEAIIDVSDWTVDLQPGDMIPYGLTSFSGTATWLSLSLGIKRLDATRLGVGTLTDEGSTEFTNGSGDPFTVRN